ncbi:Proline--tRNA ligase [compost metagenome]
MRGREFTMKDAYSFDRDTDGLRKSYENMYDAYVRIFSRFGLEFRAVAADNGAIGGSGSHEFHVIADTGEDAIVYCPTSAYAANMEAAEALPLVAERAAPKADLVKTFTPEKVKCEQVAEFLNIPLERNVKSIVLATDSEAGAQIWLLLIRADHELNEVKASKVPGLADFRFATENEIVDAFGSSAAPTTATTTTPASTGAATCPSRSWPTCATWSWAMPRRTARARWRSAAASRWATCSCWARVTRNR